MKFADEVVAGYVCHVRTMILHLKNTYYSGFDYFTSPGFTFDTPRSNFTKDHANPEWIIYQVL